MPLREYGATDIQPLFKSRLGESLLRLHQNVDQSRTAEHTAEHQFHEWQERWSSRKEQISRRLELIDKQLETLVKMHQLRPQLSLVADPGHDDEQAPVAR